MIKHTKKKPKTGKSIAARLLAPSRRRSAAMILRSYAANAARLRHRILRILCPAALEKSA